MQLNHPETVVDDYSFTTLLIPFKILYNNINININALSSKVALICIVSLETNVFGLVDNPSISVAAFM